MDTVNIVRAWKDSEYRASLSPEQLGLIPPSPAGNIELSDDVIKVGFSDAGVFTESVTCTCGVGCNFTHSTATGHCCC